MLIAERLWIPDESKAVLWDMDGVLLDTLGLDLTLCNQLLNKYLTGKNINLSKEFIRSIFAYHPPEFWRLIFKFIESEYQIVANDHIYNEILNEYNTVRNNSVFEVNPGIIDILTDCKKKNIKCAVVSNNPTEDVRKIIAQSGIADYFDIIVGNDLENLKTKPAPDTYIYAAKLLDISPDHCVVVEDSLLGAEAGYHAGCFTIGVATGSADFEDLEQAKWTRRAYSSFEPNCLSMQFGDVRNKRIVTPNDFVSHMIEHIAWRLGCSIDLYWNSNDWLELGRTIGNFISNTFQNQDKSGAALGMIDDGSAEVAIELSEKPDAVIESTKRIDRDWFLSLRCEQINSGEPLVRLVKGLADGLRAKIYIRICSVEDPHHTWEGVFRSIGIALSRMFAPKFSDHDLLPPLSKGGRGGFPPQPSFTGKIPPAPFAKGGDESLSSGIAVENLSECSAIVSRKTAESNLRISVDFTRHNPGKYNFNVASSIHVDGFPNILDKLSGEAGLTLAIDYDATVLSSSHVVMEDTALVLGRALKEILVLRMNRYGVQGAGSSVTSAEDVKNQPVSVGVSVEGRKFWKFMPFNESYDAFRKRFLIGQNVSRDLFSEDLDDFIDGLAGGLDCSIMIHIKEAIEPARGWEMIFTNMGKALKEVFQPNPYRKGVPPGVKATMY
jgi:HAD superfamily hydrolase (TIGR01509 family)